MPEPSNENAKPRVAEASAAEIRDFLAEMESGRRIPGGGRPKPRSVLLLGCFGLLVFTVVSVAAVGGMTLLRASKSGLTMELAREKPKLASAMVGVTLNPNLDLVEIDRYRNRLTIRNRQTGDTRVVTPDELSESGRQGLGGGQQSGEGAGGESLFGLFRSGLRIFGMGPGMPEWIPPYPGARAGGKVANDSARGTIGVARFTSADPPSSVIRFYIKELRNAGLTVTMEPRGIHGQGTVNGSSPEGHRTVAVRVTRSGSHSAISVAYSVEYSE